ncbi:unnamed protein product [Pleuronectes platessa]|uniref:Protein kinase domain-containing protein n=1 Tax=Pleuronectes platessa TaxID=8262 RepID=A0A9N7TNE2_PLEPL|nr:unnamed protein product [Pleuronectes platessa]
MVKGEVVGPPADMWTVGVVTFIMLSGRLPFEDKDPQQVESKILIAKFDPTKLYPNVSQSASAFLKKMLSSYPWARSTTRDCFTHAWLQDSYLMKLRRQTLSFTSSRLKEFLVEQQCRRSEDATKHKVLLRTYQSSAQSTPPGGHHTSPVQSEAEHQNPNDLDSSLHDPRRQRSTGGRLDHVFELGAGAGDQMKPPPETEAELFTESLEGYSGAFSPERTPRGTVNFSCCFRENQENQENQENRELQFLPVSRCPSSVRDRGERAIPPVRHRTCSGEP